MVESENWLLEHIVFAFAGSAKMRDAGQMVEFVRVRADWMAVFQLAEWMRAKVMFPLVEYHADHQKVDYVIRINQFVRMAVDDHENVYYFGWIKGH